MTQEYSEELPAEYYQQPASNGAPILVPIALIALSVICFFSYQLAILLHEADQLTQAKAREEQRLAQIEKQLEARKQQLGPFQQSRQGFVGFAQDLMALAANDADAASIVKKYGIREGKPSSASITPADGN